MTTGNKKPAAHTCDRSTQSPAADVTDEQTPAPGLTQGGAFYKHLLLMLMMSDDRSACHKRRSHNVLVKCRHRALKALVNGDVSKLPESSVLYVH